MEYIIAKLLQDFERGQISRRQLIQSLALAGAAAFSGTSVTAAASGLKTISVDHISYRVPDYKRTRDFYAGLLGMKVTDDTGTQCELRFGDQGSMITARNPRQRPGQPVGEGRAGSPGTATQVGPRRCGQRAALRQLPHQGPR
jgi:hypothetical protein